METYNPFKLDQHRLQYGPEPNQTFQPVVALKTELSLWHPGSIEYFFPVLAKYAAATSFSTGQSLGALARVLDRGLI